MSISFFFQERTVATELEGPSSLVESINDHVAEHTRQVTITTSLRFSTMCRNVFFSLLKILVGDLDQTNFSSVDDRAEVSRRPELRLDVCLIVLSETNGRNRT